MASFRSRIGQESRRRIAFNAHLQPAPNSVTGNCSDWFCQVSAGLKRSQTATGSVTLFQRLIIDEERALIKRLLGERLSLHGICRAVGIGIN